MISGLGETGRSDITELLVAANLHDHLVGIVEDSGTKNIYSKYAVDGLMRYELQE